MQSRTKNALITLIIGLAFNIGLGVSKLVVGIMSDSTSVTSDALNNLSDAAVSLVTIFATALASRHADHDHPFGHGRYEYIATFVVGASILAVGIEVGIEGFRRIINPVAVDINTVLFATLIAAIAVKASMAVLYGICGKKSGSSTLAAAAADSAFDVIVTSAVLACAIAEKFTGARIDGYASMAVAVVIVVLAVRMLMHTVSRLLGERPDGALYETVRSILTEDNRVLSVHDIVINDYGADCKIAEADAVFDADMPFVEVHTICDFLERMVKERTGIKICIHADPFAINDKRLVDIKNTIDGLLAVYSATAHDIHIDDTQKHITFDIAVPDDHTPVAEIIDCVRAKMAELVGDYTVEICIDYI